jgi:non-specific serine/threonine protein kinase
MKLGESAIRRPSETKKKSFHHSIKLDELARELTENIGDHKALIFFAVLGMLALIKAKLESWV